MEDNLNYFQMEEDLNILVIGRQPQQSCEWKTTPIFVQMEDDLNILLMKNDL